ncbi:MAG: hypothetical protein ACTSRK_09290 [Promethearchaeota archaeon]
MINLQHNFQHPRLRGFIAGIDGRVYSKEEYDDQFSILIDHYLAKYDRMEVLFKEESDMPEEIWEEMAQIRQELNQLKERVGKSIVLPSEI